VSPANQPQVEPETVKDTIAYGDVPGPGLLALIGTYTGYVDSDPTTSFSKMRNRWGEVVRLYLPVGGWAYLLSNPQHIQYVLETNQKNYKKSEGYRELRHAMGDGLLTSEGDKWLQQHRLMMPMFHQDSIMEFGDMIIHETQSMIDRWEQLQSNGEPINLLQEMKRITLKIICRGLFSSNVEPYVTRVGEILDTLRSSFQSRVRGFSLPLWIPTPTNRAVKNAMQELNGIVNRLINDRRGHEGEYEDFLSMLMLAEDEETGATMSHEQIRDEVMTFFLAGHETTANALTWTWYALSNNPEIHSNLHDHASSILNGHNGSFSYELYEKLDYAGNIVDESMRLYPPVPIFGREAKEDDVIDQYEVPAGTTLLLSQYLIHRDRTIWDDPETFDPDRFADDKQDDRHRYSYFPFGGGARMCIGRELALLEARLILSLVTKDYRLERTEPQREIGTDVAVTMTPNDPITMSLDGW